MDFLNYIKSIGEVIKKITTEEYSPAVSKVQALIDGTGTLIALYLTIWIMIEGYKMAFGKNGNFKDFLWNAGLKSAFILLAVNATFWTELVWTTFSEAREYVADAGFDPIKNMIDYANAITNITNAAVNDAKQVTKSGDLALVASSLKIFIFMLLIWLGFFIGFVAVIRVYITNAISFLILMVLSPIAFYFLIFNITKQSFGNWFSTVLSNLITLICLGILLALVMNFAEVSFLNDFKKGVVTDIVNTGSGYIAITGLDYAPLALKSIVLGIFINIFTSMATSIAQSITSASIENIANSAYGRAFGIGGSVVGGMAGATFLGSRGAIMGLGNIGHAGSKAIGYIGSKFKGK